MSLARTPALFRLARPLAAGAMTLLLASAVFAAGPQRQKNPPLPVDEPPPSPIGSESSMSEAPAALRAPSIDACVLASTFCEDTAFGELEPTDCTLDDGSYFDAYAMPGVKDQLVAVSVRPRSASYTEPLAFLIPPAGNASKTPLTVGGKAATVWYRLTSGGQWSVAAGTGNLFSTGAYVLDVTCDTDRPPVTQQQCIYQELLCGQQQLWHLTAQSCRFNTDPNRLYQIYEIYGVAGDVLAFDMRSNDFRPLMGIYDANNIALNPTTNSAGSTSARLTYRVPATGMYHLIATSQDDFGVGAYVLTTGCSTSGCLYPLIISQPREVQVAYGERATLTLETHHVGPVEYRWQEFTDFPTPVATTTTPTWQTPPVTGTHTYYVTAWSPCGTHDSERITVSVREARRRAVRK